jgi:DNA repair exonuclease SbcCD nuclease subunit
MKLALIADLHFGSVPRGLADELAAALARLAPDAILVAGDLTMRARAEEFAEARKWLNRLEAPLLVLPGNHDLPYFDLLERFADPFGRFKGAVEGGLMPVISREDCFILGLNTAASAQPHFRWQEGVARKGDISAAQSLLVQAVEEAF